MQSIKCNTCNGTGEIENNGPKSCTSCGGNGYIEVSNQDLVLSARKTFTHIECIKSGECQETKGFKGTEHEGVDVCEDGCVWFNPRNI